jgi:hypothetical protein
MASMCRACGRPPWVLTVLLQTPKVEDSLYTSPAPIVDTSKERKEEKMPRLVSVFLLVAAALFGQPTRAESVKSPQDARAMRVVRDAIRAHGGLEALRRVYSRYTVYVSSKSRELGEQKLVSYWVAPDRWVLKDRNGPMDMRVFGERCVAMVNGRAFRCTFKPEKLKQDLFGMHVADLYPLVEPGVVLRYLGTRKDGKRRVALVEVRDARGPSKAILGFDTVTKLHVTTRQRSVVRGVKTVETSRTRSFVTVRGAKVPRKIEEYKNGRHTATTTLEKLVPGKVDRRLFKMPD